MGRPFRATLLVFLALMPAACAEVRKCEPPGPLDRPMVSVMKPGSDRSARACVDRVAVFDSELRGLAGAVWRVRSANDRCVDLDTIVYGETPEGFVVDTPPQPLRAGVVYAASGHGWTTGFPRVPWHGGGRFIFHDGAWSPVEPRSP